MRLGFNSPFSEFVDKSSNLKMCMLRVSRLSGAALLLFKGVCAMKEKACCFIGHRRVFSQVRDRLDAAVREQVKNGCLLFLMGTHGEFDDMALEVCRSVRKDNPSLKIRLVITNLHYLERYPDEERYNSFSDIETIMFEIELEHYKRRITSSNRQMIDMCDALICCVDTSRTRSGAKSAMLYAKRRGLNVTNLYRKEDSPSYNMTPDEVEKYHKKIRDELSAINQTTEPKKSRDLF